MTALADPDADTRVRAGRSLASAATIVVAVSLPSFMVGALTVPISRDLDFGAAELGIALGCCYAITAALSPGAGRVVTRIGAEHALRVAGALTTVGLVAIALAPSPALLATAVAFVGIPNALTQPASNEMLAGIDEPRMRALSFGLVQAAVPTGALVAGTAVAMASYGTSWRTVFLLAAATTLVGQAVVPRTAARHAAPRQSAVSPPPGPARVDGGAELMAALVVSGCLASAAATALPAYAATSGLAAGAAAWLVAAAQIGGSLASITVRVLAPVRTSAATLRTRLLTIAALQGLGAAAMLCLATGTPTGYVVGTLAAFGFGWGWNGLYNLVVALARPGKVARSTGLSQAGVFAGGALGPLAFGLVAHERHVSTGWLAMALVLAIAAAAAATAARHARTVPIPTTPEEICP